MGRFGISICLVVKTKGCSINIAHRYR